MHPKVLSARNWKIARELADAGILEGWVLAGGTGLALQLGHRVSQDLDFFQCGSFSSEDLVAALGNIGPVAVQARSAGTLHAAMKGLRVSFLAAQVPLLFPGIPYRGLLVADPRDIAVMKVIAIGGRGSRKDFIDLFFFLQCGGSLEAVFQMIQRRFKGIDFNQYHLLRSLVFFEDAETEPMPRLLRRVAWAEVKKTFQTEVRRLS